MENLKKYTPIELLNLVNNLKLKHENLKNVVIVNIKLIEDLENEINEKLVIISETEEEYIRIIEEINNR